MVIQVNKNLVHHNHCLCIGAAQLMGVSFIYKKGNYNCAKDLYVVWRHIIVVECSMSLR